MTKRRFITQLPYVHQTEELRKFFSSTVDQVFQPGETQSVNAFIGRKPAYFNAKRDFYKTEINAERAYYQLEPAMTTTATDGSFVDLLFYPDVVNKLRFQGANTTDHSRLFNTDYYSWCPPVNIAKLDSYRDYYWLPDGPPIMVFNIPVAGAYNSFAGDGKNRRFAIHKQMQGKVIVQINDETLPATAYTVDDGNVILQADTPAPSEYDTVTVFGDNAYYTDGNTQAFDLPTRLPELSQIRLVVMINDEIIIDDFTWDGNVEDGLVLDGNYPNGVVDGNIDLSFDIVGNQLVFSEVIPAGNHVRIWLNGNFKEYIEGEESFTYPAAATAYTYNTITVQRTDEDGMLVTARELKKYPEKVLPNPPALAAEMRVRIIDNNGDNLHRVTFIGGELALLPTEAPTQPSTLSPQYITIERYATNRNGWSTNNFWFHRDVLLYSDPEYQPGQASRPIVEYFNNVQLINYGAYMRDPVDFTLNDNVTGTVLGIGPDGKNTNVTVNGLMELSGDYRTNFAYPAGQARDEAQERKYMLRDAPLINGSYIQHGTRILVTNSGNSTVDDQILVASVTKDESRAWDTDAFTNVTNFDNALWDQIEMLSFDIEQREDGSGTLHLDQVKVLPKTEKNTAIAQIPTNEFLREYWFDAGPAVWKEITYYVGQEPLFDLFDRTNVSLNKYANTTFAGSKIFSYQRDENASIDPILNLNVARNKYGLIVFQDHLATDTWAYGVNRASTYEGYTYFGVSSIAGDRAVLGHQNNWHVAGTTSQTVNEDGLYSIPTNLRANPLNLEIEYIASNDWKSQFNDLLAANNWNVSSDQFDLGAGEHIVQSRGTLLKTMLMCSDSNLDFIKAAIYTEHEYTRYRNKFVNLLKQYEIQTGLDDIQGSVNNLLAQLKSAKTADFPFYNNGVIGDYFIPATGAYLGMTPLWKPELILEIGRNGSLILVRGHDGSLIPGSSRFASKTVKLVGNTVIDTADATAELSIDNKDLALLTFETMVYDSCMTELKAQRRPVFDIKSIQPGKFRTVENGLCEYSRSEYQAIARPIFERWVTRSGLKYRTNNGYDAENPFTWNYSNCVDYTGEKLPGFWRGIYQHYFDTDRPHTHPWEMLGFTSKPAWWNYSWTDSTRQDLIDALTVGLVVEPRGIPMDEYAASEKDPLFAREDFARINPVDAMGNLLDPIEAKIVVLRGVVPFDHEWDFGDMAPAEYQWYTGVSHSFILSQLSYLMKPVKFVESTWETADEIEVYGYDWVSKKTGRRVQIQDYKIHNEMESGVAIRVLGLQAWLSDYLRSTGKDVTTSFGDRVRALGVNLAHKLGGFMDESSLNAFTENSGLIPQEDVKTLTYNSPSIREEFYGGVIVQWTGRGWKVIGYDAVDPVFKVLPIDPNGAKFKVTVDETPETQVNDWHANTYYQANVPVLHKNQTYRCSKTHTSAREFEKQFWTVDNTIIRNNVNSLLYYRNHIDDVQRIPYGTELFSKQAVADFLSGYEAYLKSRGWDFAEYDMAINDVLDWKFATQQFLSWSQVGWAPNTFIALSPAANKISFYSKHGTIENVEQLVNGVYSLLGKDGAAIEKSKVSADRTDTGITVTVNDDKIFGLRLSVNEVEQAIVFRNKTIFNDVIYEPLFDVRQNRIRMITLLTTQWTGKLDAPGFIIADNQVLPSFEKQVEDIRNMYDIEKTINLPLRENARHQIGYQNRPYLEQLMYNETNQFEFYQGMIQQKGAPGVFNKLLRNDELTQSRNLSFLEEWAFRTGEYGGTDLHSFFEMELPHSAIQQDPQLVVFRQAGSYWDLGDFDTEPTVPTGQCFEVGVPENVDPEKLSSIDPDDAILEFYSIKDVYDSRIIMPYSDGSPFTATSNYVAEKNDMPTAGYARISEAHWMSLNINTFNEQVKESPANLEMGQRVWIYDHKDAQWAMLRASKATTGTTTNRVEGIYPDVDGVRVALTDNHNLAVGELIYINKYINAVSALGGIVKVVATSQDNDELLVNEIIVDGEIISKYEYVGSDVKPEILKLTNTRVSISSLANAPIINKVFVTKEELFAAGLAEPVGGFTANELVYVDVDAAISSKLPTNQQRWRVFIWNTITGRFEKYRTQPQRIRSDLVRDVRIFDAEAVRTKRTLNAYPLLNDNIFVYDPVKGLIPGVAQKEIAFKLEYDPASYNVGFGVQDSGFTWGEEQVGRLWWNVGTTRFMEYATDDTNDDDCRITTLYSQIDQCRDQIAQILRANPGMDPVALKVLTDPINAQIDAMLAEIPSRQAEIDAEIKYRRNNWGSIAPNTTIDIYEWTRSDVPPSEWAGKVTAGTNKEVYDGVVLNAADPNYVESTIWDEQLGADVPVYYFWVKGKKTVPARCEFREMSAASVAQIITNPKAAGIAWAAPISPNAFVIAGVEHTLTDSSSIQFKVARVDSDVNRHVEWDLMREGDERSVPTYTMWNKITQSLMGRNHKGETLPSTKRYVTDRVGYDVEHGQSLVADLKNARKHLVQYLNGLFASIPVIDVRRNTSVLNYTDMDEPVLQWYQKSDSFYYEPLPDNRLYDRKFNTQFEFIEALKTNPELVGLVSHMGQEDAFWSVMKGSGSSTMDAQGNSIGDTGTIAKLWDMTVNSFDELNALVGKVSNKIRVKVMGNAITGGFATIWKLNAGGNGFDLVTTQKYDSSAVYELADWYAAGYSFSNPPLLTFASTAERDLRMGTNPATSFVKIANDGNGKWLWTQFVNGSWVTVAKQDATIRMRDAVWQNTGNHIETTTTLPDDFAAQVTNRDMGYELNVFMNSLREYMLTNMEMNALFFSMVSYIHTEQNSIDWCFKTSFMYVTGYTERLLQDPIAYVDRTGNLLDYINEVKPYHVKVRDFISKYGIADTANLKVTDFDFPLYYDAKLGKYRQLNPAVASDVAIIKGGVWSAWYNQYVNDNNASVRKLNISMLPAPSAAQRAIQEQNGDPTTMEVARLKVTESVRLRVFRRGDVGAPPTSLQVQNAANLDVMLPNVMPSAASIAVFADGLRVDPASLTWNPYTSHITTANWNKQTKFEVMGFGYGATGVIRDVQYFHKTNTVRTFDLGYDCRDVVASQLLITANGSIVTGTISNGIVTVPNATANGLVQIAVLDTQSDTFNQVTTARFGATEIAGKSLAQLYPALTSAARAPMMNNFVIEIDGLRVAPEMIYQTNINKLNRVLRLERNAPVSDLSVRFNGAAVTLGGKFVKVNDVITCVNNTDMGVLEIADKGAGQIGVNTPITDVFPDAKVVTITDFKAAPQMGARSWSYRTDIQTYYPISALPANDAATWITLNGRRLELNVDYKIVRTAHPGWEEFIWDREGLDSDEWQLRGSLADALQPANATMDNILTYGIELLVPTVKGDLLVATVFENKQASYARVFEVFVKDKVAQPFDIAKHDYEAWDHEEDYTVPREITLGDRYELIANIDRSQTTYSVRQAAGPFTRDTIKFTDIEDKAWLQNEYVTIQNITEGANATLTGDRGANVTVAVPHSASSSVVAPRIIGPEYRYMPL